MFAVFRSRCQVPVPGRAVERCDDQSSQCAGKAIPQLDTSNLEGRQNQESSHRQAHEAGNNVQPIDNPMPGTVRCALTS